jgi:hypothetical protein
VTEKRRGLIMTLHVWASRLAFLGTVSLLAVLAAIHFGRAAKNAATKPGGDLARPRLAESYGKLPLSFEANQGQTNARVRFLSRGRGYTLFLTGDEAVLSLRKADNSAKPDARPQSGLGVLESRRGPFRFAPPLFGRERDSVEGARSPIQAHCTAT